MSSGRSGIFLRPPERFSFRGTVTSHGWCGLAPFSFDDERGELSYVFTIEAGTVLRASAKQFKEGLRIRAEVPAEKAHELAVADGFRRILAFDEDIRGFQTAVSSEPSLRWIAKANAGRMLRSPTVFEDVVKTICTTNCSWSLTKLMVSRIVESLGGESASGLRAFPTPEAMASKGPEFFRETIRAGYRSEYLHEFATRVAEGRTDPETWLDSRKPTDELKQDLLAIKGVGKYAAESMLKLLGRYDSLALDSFLRSEFYKKHNRDEKCADSVIEAYYEPFGEWRGLVMWFDMCGE